MLFSFALYPSCKEKSRFRPLCPRRERVGPEPLGTQAQRWRCPSRTAGATGSVCSQEPWLSVSVWWTGRVCSSDLSGTAVFAVERPSFLLKPSGADTAGRGQAAAPEACVGPSGSPCRRCSPPGSGAPVHQRPCPEPSTSSLLAKQPCHGRCPLRCSVPSGPSTPGDRPVLARW